MAQHSSRPPTNIVLVDEIAADADAFQRALRRGLVAVDVTHFDCAEDALAYLEEGPLPDLLVTGYNLPEMDGLELCEELLAEDVPFPVVMLTGAGDERVAVQAMQLGVDDYLIKDDAQGYLDLLPVVLPAVVRKHADQVARRRSEERYRTLFEESPIALWQDDFSAACERLQELRDQGVEDLAAYLEDHPEEVNELASRVCITDVNQATLELLGAESKEQLLGSMEALLLPESHEVFCREVLALAAGERSEGGFQTLIRAMDGRRRTVAVNWAVLSSTGEPWSDVLVSMMDMSERVQAEHALRESEERYRTIFRAESDVIMVIDSENMRIVDANDAARRIYGYSPDDLVGMRFPALVADVDGPGGLQQALGEHRSFQPVHQHHRRRDGSVFPVEISSSQFRLHNRRLICAIVRDVTKRAEAEATLEGAMAELARSNQELQEFAYVASHDLREPLRTIGSYARLLERRYREDLDQSARDFLDFIVDGVVRMQKLIEGMLNYSRVHTHGAEFRAVPLEEVLEEVRDMLALTIENHEGRVSSGPLPVVWGDRGQLIRLMENLVVNALHYRGDEPPRIHISAEPTDGHWKVSVSDNGIGIDAAHRERIFALFQRLHTQAERPGTGAGLAICRRIVKRHDGDIWVESKPDEGSTFHFTLPAVPEQS